MTILHKVFKKQDKKSNIAKNIHINFLAKDKWDAIAILATRLVENYNIAHKETLIQEIYTREKQISTGFEFGIAIPHVKTNLVNSIICGIAVAKEGIDFDSIDKLPATIIILVLTPKGNAGEHMQLIASLSKLLSIEANRTKILQARTEQEVADVFQIKFP